MMNPSLRPRAAARRAPVFFLLLLGLLWSPPHLRAQVPGLLNFQGRVLADGVPFHGAGQFKFALVNGDGTVTLWSNDGTSINGNEPAAAATIAVAQGNYSVLLGDAALANMSPVPAGAFAHDDVRLRVWFNDGTHGFQRLDPDQRIAAVGYALAANVPDGVVTAAKLAPALNASLARLNSSPTFSGTVTADGFSGSGAGLKEVPGTQTYEPVAGTVQRAEPNGGYLLTNPAPTTVILPATAAVGDLVRVLGTGDGGWQVRPPGGQSLQGYPNSPAGAVWTARESERIWFAVASSATGSKLVAAVYNGQLHTSADFGASWTARETSRRWTAVASSEDGSKLVAAVGPGRLYTSDDSGETWTMRESNRSWASVASSADGIKLVAAVANGQIYTSTDSGVNWTVRGESQDWRGVASSADGSKLVAVAGGGQIFTSADSGVTWTARGSVRDWRGVASSADGAKLVAVVEGGQIYTSTDSGVSWTAHEEARNWSSVASSADGTKLVAGVLGGQIYTSTDSGGSWLARESDRTWTALASSAAGDRLVAVATRSRIYTSTATISRFVGASGSAAGFRYLGKNAWQPVAESGLVLSATTANSANTLVARDGAGDFSAGTITATFSGDGSGLTALDGANLTAGSVTDDKLDTISTAFKVANSATTATHTNAILTIVQRDSQGGFSAGLISARFQGDGAGLTNLAGTFAWEVVAGTSRQAVANHGYLANHATQVTITLPASPNVGDTVRVSGAGAGGWRLAQNADQQILRPHDPAGHGQNWTARATVQDWRGVASSADGSKLVAVVYGGRIYTSADSGVSWTARESSRNWTAVASSADGTKLVATVEVGRIYTSADSGVNWTARENSRDWRAVASAADGGKLVAVVGGGQIYTSTDSGVNWTARESNRDWRSVASSAGGTKLVAAVANGFIFTSTDSGVTWDAKGLSQNWRAVASSSDGTLLTAVAHSLQVWTSTDSGASWTAREGARDWRGVASSDDGRVRVAVGSDSKLYVSSDSGVSWPARDSARAWRGVAASANGTKLVAVVGGGQIYTSGTGTTTRGPAGYVTGGQFTALELQYIGNGQFLTLSQQGTLLDY